MAKALSGCPPPSLCQVCSARSALPCCVKANAALMNNAGSAGRLLLTFSLLSTCQAVGVCQGSSGSAELRHVSTEAELCYRCSSVQYSSVV